MIVVDTNVMIHLLMGGEHGPDAALLLQQDPEWAAPVILMSELRNVLLGFVRRGVFVSDRAKAMTDDAATIHSSLVSRGGTVPAAQITNRSSLSSIKVYSGILPDSRSLLSKIIGTTFAPLLHDVHATRY